MVVVLVLESKVLYWSFSPDVTAWRMFVYKKNPVGFELYSHVKTFYYSQKFAKLLTTLLKTIYWCFWHNDKRRVLKSHCCFLTFLFQNRRGGRGRPVIPLPFYKERGGGGGGGVGGWRRWNLSLEFLIYCSISKRFCVIVKSLLSSQQDELYFMGGGAAGGLWRRQKWSPSWILPRNWNLVKKKELVIFCAWRVK